MFGKLINLFADLDARALRSSSYFKTVSTGDSIDAERKHKDPFFFRPFARLVFSANELPKSPDTSHAYFRRWVIIPFPHRFEGKQADKTLADKLTQPLELSGLFNRALLGLNRLFRNKEFSESATVRNALEDYRRQNNTIGAFIRECCVFDPILETERTALFDAYAAFCEEEGFEPETRQNCYNQVRRTPQVVEKRSGKFLFIGIGIKQTSMKTILRQGLSKWI